MQANESEGVNIPNSEDHDFQGSDTESSAQVNRGTVSPTPIPVSDNPNCPLSPTVASDDDSFDSDSEEFVPGPSSRLSEKATNEVHRYLPLSHAISHGDLQGVRDFLDRVPTALTAWIDAVETPLLKACSCGQVEIVKELLRRMTPEQMLIPPEKASHSRTTPLFIAAANGNLEIAAALIEKNPKLPEISSRRGADIPVVASANAGHKEMTRFLYQRTPLSILLADEGNMATGLLLHSIFYGFIDIALQLLEVNPCLAVTKHPRLTSTPVALLASKSDLFLSGCYLRFCQRMIYSFIEVKQPIDAETSTSTQHQSLITKILLCLPQCFGVSQIYELKAMHRRADSFLQVMCKKISEMVKDEQWTRTIRVALFIAVRNGNKDFVVAMIKSNPELLWSSFGDCSRNIFQVAVEFRKEKILELVYGLDERRNYMLNKPDKKGNKILHIAGGLSPPDELSRVGGAALKMQKELKWFKEIESMVPDIEKERKDSKGRKPREIFEAAHEPLRGEAEKWMKDTATACSFVAALIATVTFQAIFTVPGGTDDASGDPLRLRDVRFMVFIVADILSFFSSCTSVLIFLGILTARYSFDDFLKSLPKKMILGLSGLLISIAAMLVAFSTALITTLRQTPSLVIPVIPLACLPVALFVMMQYPLLKEMISSTYGKGLFDKDTKPWF